MDRRVKERLIGASILVVLFVLVVPELLSGPKPASPPGQAPRLPASAPEPVRNVTVDLATSKPPVEPDAERPNNSAASASPAATLPISPAAPPATSVREVPNGESTVDEPESASGTAAPPPATSTPATAPPATAVPATSAPTQAAVKRPAAAKKLESQNPSPTLAHGWAVQVGTFASRVNADNLMQQVKAQGFAAYVLPGGAGSAQRYRVRVGPVADRVSADRMLARLKTLGHQVSIVAPTK